jgi:hypothetical protein
MQKGSEAACITDSQNLQMEKTTKTTLKERLRVTNTLDVRPKKLPLNFCF